MQQEDFCSKLKTELEKIELPYDVFFFTDQHAPPVSAFEEIKDRILQFVQETLIGLDKSLIAEESVYHRFPSRGTQNTASILLSIPWKESTKSQ